MQNTISRRLFTVHEYHRMAEAGILRKNDRVELIRGEVLTMSPIGSPHNGSVIRANNSLFPIVGTRAMVCVQGAVRLDMYSEPQPDIALLRPRDDFYTRGHAGPQDILLIVEIADSSLDFDQTIMADVYSDTGVKEYWIADIQKDCLWAYSDPDVKGYQTVRQLRRGESLAPLLLPDRLIPVDIFLP